MEKKLKNKKKSIVKEHYIKEAKEFGLSKQSTMRDINIKDKETEKTIQCLNILKDYFEKSKILEVGCGNGYVAEQITKKFDVELVGIDFCEEFIKIAKKRNLKKATFQVGDVLNLKFDNASFDIVFAERCLINLDSWKKQQKALNEIRRVLKDGGVFLMIEAFTDGLDNLNKARKSVGLDNIPQPYHNLFFNKKKFLQFIKDKFEDFSATHPSFAGENYENFLSSYYFGSRVLYPALIMGKKELVYNNKFVEFFRYMPGYGNYSSVQMFILKKIARKLSKKN